MEQRPHVNPSWVVRFLATGLNVAAAFLSGACKTEKEASAPPPPPVVTENNPRAWYITVNGMVVDARSRSRGLQEIAYENGLIPSISQQIKNP